MGCIPGRPGARNAGIPQAFMDVVDVVKGHNAKNPSSKHNYTRPFADESILVKFCAFAVVALAYELE